MANYAKKKEGLDGLVHRRDRGVQPGIAGSFGSKCEREFSGAQMRRSVFDRFWTGEIPYPTHASRGTEPPRISGRTFYAPKAGKLRSGTLHTSTVCGAKLDSRDRRKGAAHLPAADRSWCMVEW